MLVGMASTGDPWRLGRRPALHGLRGVAILLVFVDHARLLPQGGQAIGAAGVTMFFTLSGFLISSLLLEERERTGRISLRQFYVRRARRLLPALAAFVFTMVLCSVAISRLFLPNVRDLLATVFYVSNWPQAAGVPFGGIGQTWSLGIEEQFYIVWPLVMIAVLPRLSQRWIMGLCGAGIAGSVVLRLLLWDSGDGWHRVYFGTDTHADALLFGCALAVYMHGRTERERGRPLLASVAVGSIAAIGLGMPGFWSFEVVALMVPPLTVIAIVALVDGRSSSWLASRPLLIAGERSYGFYLWHYPLLWIVAQHLTWSPWLSIPLCTGVAALLTELSWRFIEGPFRNRRRTSDETARATPEPTLPGVRRGPVTASPAHAEPVRAGV